MEASPFSSPIEDIEDLFMIPCLNCIEDSPYNANKLRDMKGMGPYGRVSENPDLRVRDSINIVPQMPQRPSIYEGFIFR